MKVHILAVPQHGHSLRAETGIAANGRRCVLKKLEDLKVTAFVIGMPFVQISKQGASRGHQVVILCVTVGLKHEAGLGWLFTQKGI